MLASRSFRSLLVFFVMKPRVPASNALSSKRVTSRENADYRRFASIARRKEDGLLLLEGPKLLKEAIASGVSIEAIATSGEQPVDVRGIALPRDVRRFVFPPPLLRALSDVETPQGIVAIAERPRPPRDWLTRKDAFVLLLDRVQDPGNVGTLMRTAEAAGVNGVVLTAGCADPFAPKALRASAGSAFRLPQITDLSAADAVEILPGSCRLLATVADPEAPSLFDALLMRPIAIALGSEGRGLDPAILARAAGKVRIPQARPVESLNVAAAGAIALFEVARRAGILEGMKP